MEQPFAIHFGTSKDLIARFEAEARSRGMSVIELDLTDLSDRSALADYLAKAFSFPHRTTGLDAAVDLISDLEWLGNAAGYLVIARGLSDISDVSDAFVSMLPNIVDRWRSQAVPFVVAIETNDERVRARLLAANDEIARAGKLPWAQPDTGAVDVILHGRDSPGTRP